ncbi:MAG: flavin reductase family protein [Actinomycetota bacterium]|nr:flavin reductase family protein [Actinomycetota bacterium]
MVEEAGAKAFEALVADLDYPMLVVTAAAGGRRAGCMVGFATQCSMEPPRLLLCISKRNFTFGVAARAGVLAVHFLGRDDLELARLFGSETGHQVDKFARCRWQPGPGGTPVLESGRGWIAGDVTERLPFGDHVGFVVEPFTGHVGDGGAPQLGFQAVRDLQPGHRA